MSSQSHSFKTNDSSSLESEIIEKPFWQLGSFIKFVQSGSEKKKKKKAHFHVHTASPVVRQLEPNLNEGVWAHLEGLGDVLPKVFEHQQFEV